MNALSVVKMINPRTLWRESSGLFRELITDPVSFARQLYNELIKMAARKRTYIGFFAFVAVQVTIMLLLQLPKPRERFERTLTGFGVLAEDYLGGLTLAVVIIALTFAMVAALYIALVSGDIVSKEVEEGTMRMMLCRPVSRLRIMITKWAATLIYTFVLVMFLGLSALVLSSAYMGFVGKLFVMVPPEKITAFYDTPTGLVRYAGAMAALSYSALVIASIAFMFSCFKMKPATATILTLSVLFIDMVMRNMPYFEPIKEIFITQHTASWIRTMDTEVDWASVMFSWVYLGIANLVCFTIGAWRFCRRDFKS